LFVWAPRREKKKEKREEEEKQKKQQKKKKKRGKIRPGGKSNAHIYRFLTTIKIPPQLKKSFLILHF